MLKSGYESRRRFYGPEEIYPGTQPEPMFDVVKLIEAYDHFVSIKKNPTVSDFFHYLRSLEKDVAISQQKV